MFYYDTLHAENSNERHDFSELQPRVSIDDAHAENIPKGVGVRGHVTMTGPIFQYRLTHDDLHKPLVWKWWNKSKVKINTANWMLDHTIETPLDIWCMVVAEDEIAKLLVCLCLLPLQENKQQWKRIGVCHWDGLMHQVGMFSRDKPINKRVTIV